MTSTSSLAALLAGIPGGPEIWIVLFIVLILFGRRLPGVARSLGQGISSFKKGLSEPLDQEEEKQNEAQSDSATEKSSEKKTEKRIEETSEG